MESNDTNGNIIPDPPMRKSMFVGIPPYINYVPEGGFSGEVTRGQQYWDQKKWDQDQLWRFSIAMGNWIEDCLQSENSSSAANWEVSNRCLETANKRIDGTLSRRRQVRSKRQSLEIKAPFDQRPDDSKKFSNLHLGVKLCQFPKMRQVSRKDLLGHYFHLMQNRYGLDEFGFHPRTYTLPVDRKQLIRIMAATPNPANDLWMVKPPSLNNGRGVHVLNSLDGLELLIEQQQQNQKQLEQQQRQLPRGGQQEVQSVQEEASCVQRYIRNPLLIDGLKFDIRIYILLTSLDPLKLYMYDDGLVRIATEKYTEDAESIYDSCIHVTNFAVNKKNTEKFRLSYDPGACEGHKWRLRVLWKYLREIGLNELDFDHIWSQIEDIAVKTVLIALPEMREDFNKIAEYSCYNTYKLLGYDLMIDKDLKVHLIEVNGRPELKDHVLDKTVNRPMMAEMLRIVGYHIPKTLSTHRQFISTKFGLGKDYGDAGHSGKWPVTFTHRLYSRVNIEEDNVKQAKGNFQDKVCDREAYLESILEDLTPFDIRTLVKAEEELSQANHFTRLFPSERSHEYIKYFYNGIPYADKVMDAWETKYGGPNRQKGIKRLKKLCNKALHL